MYFCSFDNGLKQLYKQVSMHTPGRGQSKTLLIIDERGLKKSLETVFLIVICRQLGDIMAIKNSVSNDFLSTFVDSINVLDCRLPGVMQEWYL